MKKWTMMAAWALAALAMAGCGEKPGPGQVQMAQNGEVCTSQPVAGPATPQALLTKLEAANGTWDYQSLLACMEPVSRSEFQLVLNDARRYTDRVAQMQATIRDRIGAKQARKFRDSVFPGIFTSPLGEAVENGQINWKKVHIVAQADTATVHADSPGTREFPLRRIDGQWYLTNDYYLARTGKQGLAWYVTTFDDFIKRLDDDQMRIDQGFITKGNFEKKMLAKPNGKSNSKAKSKLPD